MWLNNCITNVVWYGQCWQCKIKKSSDEEKIQQLDKDYHVDLQGSMYVYQTIDALNKYKGYGTNYVYVDGQVYHKFNSREKSQIH